MVIRIMCSTEEINIIFLCNFTYPLQAPNGMYAKYTPSGAYCVHVKICSSKIKNRSLR